MNLVKRSENILELTDSVYFDAMLSAIGVVRVKPALVVERGVYPEPWKPKDKYDECPY